jgi:hypothetical protein
VTAPDAEGVTPVTPEERRAEFFAGKDLDVRLPDLYIPTPPCPVCCVNTTEGNGGWCCRPCGVSWNGAGTGGYVVESWVDPDHPLWVPDGGEQ